MVTVLSTAKLTDA